MRSVYVRPLNCDVSVIGFGCASLGSRISGVDGQKAVGKALDLGVNWFDVAPPYGDGCAEDWLGRFLLGRREQVVICSKFGIPRPKVSLPKRILRPIARQIVEIFPKARTVASRSHALAPRPRMNPNAIEPSVIESLRLLRTDYLDVLALHEPTIDEVTDDGILEVVDRLITKGMVRSLSIAGTPECIQAGLSKNFASFIQFPDTPFMGAVPTLIGNLPLEKLPVFVTHGVFGSGVYERLLTVSDEVKKALLRTAQRHGLGDNVSMADLLLAFAFANNHNGVVITSMFSSDHIEHNCQIAGRVVSPSFADDIRNILKVGG